MQEVSIDEQLQKDLQKYLVKLQPSSSHHQPSYSSVKSAVKELLRSVNCESWKILEELLATAKKSNPADYRDIEREIDYAGMDIRSFTMLMYVYGRKQSQSFISWRYYYQGICDSGDMIVFGTWVSAAPEAHVVQETLELVIRVYPVFIRKNDLDVNEAVLNSLIEWVTYFQTADPDKYNAVCELVRVVKISRFQASQDYVNKQHIILKKLMQVMEGTSKLSGNTFLFLYPFSLKTSEINYFIHLECDFISKLGENCLINFFSALTKSAMSKELVELVKRISHFLKEEEEFFKLRLIYQRFILPVIVRRAKCCHKAEPEVFELAKFFILGFLQHANIGEEGIQCILTNTSKVQDQDTRLKWVQLCTIIGNRYPASKQIIKDSISQQCGAHSDEIDAKEFNLGSPEVVWQVTVRSSRKHKQYNKVKSGLRGIQNFNNQCYIISTVQALHRTVLFQELLDKFSSEIIGKGLLSQLRRLFAELSKAGEKRPVTALSLQSLKHEGPQVFRNSNTQEDSYEYIMALFEWIEKEMKRSKEGGLLEQFNGLFQISIKDRLVCKQCQHISESEIKSYMHTISNLEMLEETTQEKLPEFQCRTCHRLGCISIFHIIKPVSQILIVHINRFSHEGGKTKKELSTQTILRSFLNYKLMGMVCHYGKNVENGHYLYFGRIGPKRWAEFNDQEVWEFDLDAENEEFEREWKAEITPYILFYKRGEAK